MREETYLQVTHLEREQAKRVFAIYLQYENWKNDQGCYDFLDVVNHAVNRIKYGYNKNV